MALQQQRAKSSLLFPCLLALMVSPLQVAGATSSIFGCVAELEACFVDAACNSCLVSWPVGELSTCVEYSSESDLGPEVGSCEETGTHNCCGFESGTAETCMENAVLEAYWTCNLEEIGCAIDDMPCSAPGVAADAEADAAEDGEEGATGADNSARAGGTPSWACRCGAGAFAAVMIALLAAGA